MRADETIVFSDLDGTLFNAAIQVSAENRAAIRRYTAAGGRFALATGRTPQVAAPLLSGVPLNAPSVVFNGAAAYDFSSGRYLFTRPLDREAVDPLLRRAVAELPGLNVQISTPEALYSCPAGRPVQPDLRRLNPPDGEADPGALPDAPWIKCLMYAPAAEEERLTELLTAACPRDTVCCVRSVAVVGDRQLRFYELVRAGTNKGAALRELRHTPLLQGRTVLAVGDYLNDLELLAEADIAVAPANAPEEVRRRCHWVTASNDDHAIAHLLDRLLPEL